MVAWTRWGGPANVGLDLHGPWPDGVSLGTYSASTAAESWELWENTGQWTCDGEAYTHNHQHRDKHHHW